MEDGYSLLELMLCDKDAAPTDMPISLLKSITNNFSEAQQIGRGGFAVVYKGVLENGKVVAVKKLSNSIDMDEKKYIQEVHCLMRVKHRNIVRFLGYCADTQGKMLDYEGKFVMADVRERLLCFEYAPNGTLKDYITDASDGLEWMKRYRIIKGICKGLHYLHEKHIVHLDLKPANILLDANMVPKIADFSISRCFDQEKSCLITSKLIGTTGYFAPEFYTGKIHFKLDIYSLGVIITEILTGQKGYSSVENVIESWKKRLKTSSEIERILKQIRVCSDISIKCMDFNPHNRPDAQCIVELLEQTEFMDGFNRTDLQATLMLEGPLESKDMHHVLPRSRIAKFGDDEVVPISTMGKVSVTADYNKEAPLAATTIGVLLEVTGSSSTTGRAALDLVVVLDVSGSMHGDKLDQLKSAMHFVIKKLSPRDRLCIVTFSRYAARLCPLRGMSEAAKSELQRIVDGLTADGHTNVMSGLETGLEVLNDRQQRDGRSADVLLMSDGTQTHGDARQVGNPRNVPIYTVAFGEESDAQLLRDLAKNGGTFNLVPETTTGGGMSMLAVFSQLMAGLLTVVVQDLCLILSKPPAAAGDLDKIVKVAPGDFDTETNRQSGIVTVRFDDLFAGEVRKVVVHLSLLDSSSSTSGGGDKYEMDILDVAVSYPNAQGIRQTLRCSTLGITRTASSAVGMMKTTAWKLQAEQARRLHSDYIWRARLQADGMDMEGARRHLAEAKCALEEHYLFPDDGDHQQAALRTEVRQLLDRMESHKVYEMEGLPYALACETSHARQRFASRGDDVRLFATPRMDTYLEQAKQFAGNPDTLLPVADEDADVMTKWWNHVVGLRQETNNNNPTVAMATTTTTNSELTTPGAHSALRSADRLPPARIVAASGSSDDVGSAPRLRLHATTATSRRPQQHPRWRR